jgi:serine/threonine protein kinase
LEIVLQIGYALFHLHTHGVIHRDLKPENILLTESGGIKVIDFGIAQVHSEDDRMTKKKRIIGTPVYMSPEQKENPLGVSFPADIYSLAIITYELVLGKLSHGVIHLSLMPLGLQKILNLALQPDQKNRYQDVVDYITDITQYMESEQFDKDLRGSDYTSELFEELKSTHHLFLPQTLPIWPRLDIGLINSHSLGLLPIYYELFELDDGAYGIILAEPIAKGASALLYTALFKGVILSHRELLLKPMQLVAQINEILCNERIDQIFVMNILILSPAKNQLRYLSCGFGPLWHIPANINKPRRISVNNIALGITTDTEFVEVSDSWHVGDRVILQTFKAGAPNETPEELHSANFDDEFQQALESTLFLSPQRQAEALMRRVKPSSRNVLEERPVTVISIHRKS